MITILFNYHFAYNHYKSPFFHKTSIIYTVCVSYLVLISLIMTLKNSFETPILTLLITHVQ